MENGVLIAKKMVKAARQFVGRGFFLGCREVEPCRVRPTAEVGAEALAGLVSFESWYVLRQVVVLWYILQLFEG